jgi:transcription antitermination factor NusG
MRKNGNRENWKWFVIETFPGKDELFDQRAHVIGLVSFRPVEVIRVRRNGASCRDIDPATGMQRGEKRRERVVPLFGRYVFLNLEMTEETRRAVLRLSVNDVPLARRWLCYAGTDEPAQVPTDIIEMLDAPISREQAEAGAAFSYRTGQRVVIVMGSFTGIEGAVKEFDKRGNLVVEIELLGRATPLPLKVAHVRPRSSEAEPSAGRASDSLLSQTA